MASPTLKMVPADWPLIVLLAAIWGGSFIFIELALTGFSPFTLVTIRLAIGSALLIAWLIASGRFPRLTRERCRVLLFMGLTNNAIPFSLLTWSQTELGAGLASIFNAMTPLFTILVAHLWTSDDRISPSRLLALITGFAGVVVLMGGESLSELGSNLWAQLIALSSSVFYAIAGVYGRRVARLGLPPDAAAAGQCFAAFLLMTPVALVIDRPWAQAAPGWLAWGGLVSLAVLSTSFGYLIFYKVLARSGATNAALVTFLVPISAILLATTFLGERMSETQLGGMALIFTGLAVADRRLASLLAGFLRRPKLPS
jgi:drug/metabolite transporter (DMT)-like permease